MAERLGISMEQATQAWSRLLKLDLVRMEGRQAKRTVPRFATRTDVPCDAIRSAHRQTLELASDSLELPPVDMRDLSYVTLAIDPRKMELAKRLIRNFRRTLVALLEQGEGRNEVYNLNIAFFPLSGSHKRRVQ